MKAFIGIALASAALAFAPTAAADHTFYPSGTKGDGSATAYWHDLNANGVASDLTTANTLGNVICVKMRSGVTEAQLINIGSSQASGATRAQAQIAVFGAEYHFCPEYY